MKKIVQLLAIPSLVVILLGLNSCHMADRMIHETVHLTKLSEVHVNAINGPTLLRVGQTVTYTLDDNIPLTYGADDYHMNIMDGMRYLTKITPGRTITYTFDAPGEYSVVASPWSKDSGVQSNDYYTYTLKVKVTY